MTSSGKKENPVTIVVSGSNRMGLFYEAQKLILCAVTGTVRGQAKKNNVSILRKTGKSTIVTRHDKG